MPHGVLWGEVRENTFGRTTEFTAGEHRCTHVGMLCLTPRHTPAELYISKSVMNNFPLSYKTFIFDGLLVD